jgi:hypothetical protein
MPVSARAGRSILRTNTPCMVLYVSASSHVIQAQRTHMDASVSWRAHVAIRWGGERQGTAVVEQVVSEQL